MMPLRFQNKNMHFNDLKDVFWKLFLKIMKTFFEDLLIYLTFDYNRVKQKKYLGDKDHSLN